MSDNRENTFRLGSAIRRLRRQRKLTQLQLANSLNISTSYLNLIENNRRNVTGKVLISLAKELNIELSDLGSQNDGHILNDLMEVFSDEIFDTNYLKKMYSGVHIQYHTLFNFPPNTGERTTVAYTIPSSCTSIENWAFPFNLGWVSFLFIFLPIMENWLGFFSDTFLGIGTWLAFSVNEP